MRIMEEERIFLTQKALNETFESFTSENFSWRLSRINLYNSTEIKVAKSIFINWGPDPVSFSKEGYYSCLPENIAMSVWDFTGGSVI